MDEINLEELKDFAAITIPVQCGDKNGNLYLFDNKINKESGLLDKYSKNLQKLLQNFPHEMSFRESVEYWINSENLGEAVLEIANHYEYFGQKMETRRLA